MHIVTWPHYMRFNFHEWHTVILEMKIANFNLIIKNIYYLKYSILQKFCKKIKHNVEQI